MSDIPEGASPVRGCGIEISNDTITAAIDGTSIVCEGGVLKTVFSEEENA